jgi:hypothetical protein
MARMRRANAELRATTMLLGGAGYSDLTEYHEALREGRPAAHACSGGAR